MLKLTNSKGEFISYTYKEAKKYFEETGDVFIYGNIDEDVTWVESAHLPVCNGYIDEEGELVPGPYYWDPSSFYLSITKCDLIKDKDGFGITVGKYFDGQYFRDWGNNPVGENTYWKSPEDYEPLKKEYKKKKHRRKVVRRMFDKMNRKRWKYQTPMLV